MKRRIIDIYQEDLIVCDNEKCDFVIKNETGDYNVDTKHYIDTLCPKCGAILLTQKDSDNYEKLYKIINWINKWFGWLSFFSQKNKSNMHTIHVYNGFKITNEHVNDLIEKYTNKGVQLNKIVTTMQSSVVVWSISRKCVVNENGIEALEIIDDGCGNKRASYENNRLVSMRIKTELSQDDIARINNSAGIICTDMLYDIEGFRYGFIPVD